ncbi:hypothetical protein D3C80_2100730 [compost metagenome]
MLTDCFGATVAGSQITAVNASAAPAKASSSVAPVPRTPMSASWGKVWEGMEGSVIGREMGSPHME